MVFSLPEGLALLLLRLPPWVGVVARYAHPGASTILPRSSESSGRYPLPLETDHRSALPGIPSGFRQPFRMRKFSDGTNRSLLLRIRHFLSETPGNRSTTPRVNKKTAIRHPESGRFPENKTGLSCFLLQEENICGRFLSKKGR